MKPTCSDQWKKVHMWLLSFSLQPSDVHKQIANNKWQIANTLSRLAIITQPNPHSFSPFTGETEEHGRYFAEFEKNV